jgi:hypothetical protein
VLVAFHSSEYRSEQSVEGSDGSLVGLTSLNLSGETKENHEISQ